MEKFNYYMIVIEYGNQIYRLRELYQSLTHARTIAREAARELNGKIIRVERSF